MSRRVQLCVLAAVAAMAVGCAKAQARTPAPLPMLDPPVAPVKVAVPSPLPDPIVPDAPSPASPVELTEPPARTSPPAGASRGTPPPSRPATPPATTDPQVLRPNTNVAQAERETNEQLAVARRVLRTVRREELGADGRAQYDEVQRFIRSAEEALKVRNYLLARQLADKAALLARVLVKGEDHSIGP